MHKTPQKQAASDRNDLSTAIVVGALAVLALLYDGIRRVAALFAEPGLITVEAPIPAQSITADLGEGAQATVTSAALAVDGVNIVSVVSLVTAIVVHVLGLMTVAVLAVLVCRRLSRGVVFDATNTRLMFWISMSLLIGGLGEAWFLNMGLNGVFAALGADFDGQAGLLLEAVPMFAVAMAVGVLVIIFRRGAALQRETEGLV